MKIFKGPSTLKPKTQNPNPRDTIGIIGYILGLYRDTIGIIGYILELYRDTIGIIGYILGLYGDTIGIIVSPTRCNPKFHWR